ncbi:hypothetical protein HMPREF2757_07065 [Brevibacterium sp. HMSC063G07]|nr:hypothetical protein HMPREF2757_07065 [Brevibacterium sp. HMSC063G07]OFS26956.1 hypothetical protein HMPREF3162_03775 [Brevibacterium sp. HMSC07C04]
MARTYILAESPLQLLSGLEALHAAQHRDDVVVCIREDSPSLAAFASNLPEGLLRDDSRLQSGFPSPAQAAQAGHLLLGDPLSGRIQRLLAECAVRPGGLPHITVLDDGFATVRAIRLILSPNRQALVRARIKPTVRRTALGHAAAAVLRSAIKLGRLTWFSALTPDESLPQRFTAAGGKLVRHSFAQVRRCLEATAPDTPTDRAVIVGTALAADGLINQQALIDWAAGIGRQQPALYFAHRRQTADELAAIGALQGITVVESGTPLELRLAPFPAHTPVYSMPSTAVQTLPLVMDCPEIHITEIPRAWWETSAPDSLRRELNAQSALSPGRMLDSHGARRHRLVAVCDSESYLKWAAALLDGLDDSFETDLWIVESPIQPTGEQIANAVAGTSRAEAEVPLVPVSRLEGELSAASPDVVLAAATGPVVQTVYSTAARLPRRPGLVSGLPGVGLPATFKGQRYRRRGDAFIAHSEHERQLYREVNRRLGLPVDVWVGRLPMLKSVGAPQPQFADGTAPNRIIFAPQAKVPKERCDRRTALLELARAGRQLDVPVIIKVRSRPGEHETHHEEHTYIEILSELIAEGALGPDDLQVEVGPMADFLTDGAALVTVSSTAALESLDRGLRTFIIGDFGVTKKMLNEVFAGSNLIGTFDDLAAGNFRHPDPAWLEENYFQKPSEEVPSQLACLARRSENYELAGRKTRDSLQSWPTLRAELRAHSPKPVVRAYRSGRRAVKNFARVAKDPGSVGVEAEHHGQADADDVRRNVVGNGAAQSQHVPGEGQRQHGDDHAGAVD